MVYSPAVRTCQSEQIPAHQVFSCAGFLREKELINSLKKNTTSYHSAVEFSIPIGQTAFITFLTVVLARLCINTVVPVHFFSLCERGLRCQ